MVAQVLHPLVEVKNLNFSFAKVSIGGHLINRLQYESSDPSQQQDDRVLRDLNLTVQAGQRVLLVGGNGAGKSTLLAILAGKHLTQDDTTLILGRDSFRDTTLNAVRTFVSADWGHRAVAFATHAMAYSADIPVEDMMVQLQEDFPERRDKLLDLLRIDPKWRLHRLSDGQRRRVQLFLALIRPSQLIILDEVLGMLDILSRENVLAFLREESEVHGATVILATHIFDGTEVWATDVLYIRRGTIGFYGPIQQCCMDTETGARLPMYRVVETWLRRELAEQEAATRARQTEKEACAEGEFSLTNAQNRAGGYASGRLGDFEGL